MLIISVDWSVSAFALFTKKNYEWIFGVYAGKKPRIHFAKEYSHSHQNGQKHDRQTKMYASKWLCDVYVWHFWLGVWSLWTFVVFSFSMLDSNSKKKKISCAAAYL